MHRYYTNYPFRPPLLFFDRHVSIPNLAISLAALATLTDLSYQKRAMPASLSFHRLSNPAIHSLDKYGFFRTLDDDVVVTPCSDPRSPSSSSPPYPFSCNL